MRPFEKSTALKTPEAADLKTKEALVEEEVLKSYEKETSRDLKGGINASVFIQLKDDGAGIFKPARYEGLYAPQEEMRAKAKRGTYYLRERTAFLTDRALGFNLVPPTVIRKIDQNVGSFQKFIADASLGGEIGWQDIPEEELMKLFLLDYILWSSDRHDGNFLVKGNKIYAIDNGFTLGQDEFLPYVREVLEDALGDMSPEVKSFILENIPPLAFYLNRTIPQMIKDKIDQFLESPKAQNDLKNSLRALLPRHEVEACLARIKRVAQFTKRPQGIRSFNELQYKPTK